MNCYQQEIFGPVLLCVKVGSLEEAIATVNNCPSAYHTNPLGVKPIGMLI